MCASTVISFSNFIVASGRDPQSAAWTLPVMRRPEVRIPPPPKIRYLLLSTLFFLISTEVACAYFEYLFSREHKKTTRMTRDIFQVVLDYSRCQYCVSKTLTTTKHACIRGGAKGKMTFGAERTRTRYHKR